MITFGVLTIGCFVLWLILAVKKHWRKGRMLAGYGWAAAIPGLLVLAGCGVTLLLVEAFHVPDALLFTKKGLPTLVQPTVLATLIPAGYGVIFALIGIFTNAAVKKKQKKDEERDRAKAKENMLILKSIDAVGKLTYADAVAIRDGKTNGEMKEAMKAYAEVNDELYEYLLEQNSKK